MTLYLLKIAKWLLGKSAVILIALVFVVGGIALYLYLGDSIRFERERLVELTEAQKNVQAVYSRLDGIHTEIISVAEELESTRQKLKTANALIEGLEGLMSKLEYLFSTASEQRAIDQKLATAKAESETLGPLVGSLSGRHSELRITRSGLTEEARIIEERISVLESSSSEVARYLDSSWKTVLPYLPFALAAILLGPLTLKLIAFYAIAPIFQRAKPIRFAKEKLEAPVISDSGVSVTLKLKEGETAWVKESFLQASDEDMERKTRFVLNWQIPVTCLAAGLVEMIEFVSTISERKGTITVSTQDEPDMELSVVDIAAGSSIVLRPSHLVGLISLNGKAVAIRRRWSFGRAQAWMTLQFRYFEFLGSCKLVVAGVRGVRAEKVDSGEGGGRRANQDSTIGFTPDLEFGATRAETFWAYVRGFNPLFDDVFRGEGTFLCQEISKGQDLGPGRFWAGFRDAILKVVGI